MNCNSESTASGVETQALQLEAARKLEKILQELILLAEQGKAEGFFTNVKNADILSGMVGDIHNAVMDYQVGNLTKFITLISNIHFRLHFSKASMNKIVNSL